MGSKQSGPLVVQSADVERVEMPHGVFRLLADAGSTGGALGANRLTLGTGADGARPHYHAVSWEVFSVLDGTAEFLLGDRMSVVGAGGLVAVPPGLPHAFGAAADSPTDLLVIAAPGVERFEYFRRLSRIAGGRERFDDLLPDQATYDVHFVGSSVWESARDRG
ncbi:cupin domain-containing protein [Kitasatospora sp. NBC_00085]|uniref:cupin domain-containing protein n=1 Tax=unclassified Kitasatospora TaxID=2633591 RepID=UPI003250F4B3